MKMMCIYMKSSPFTRILVKRHLKDVIEFSDGSFPRLRKLCRQDYHLYDDNSPICQKWVRERNMKYNKKYGKIRKKAD